jgi:hypothetical protein
VASGRAVPGRWLHRHQPGTHRAERVVSFYNRRGTAEQWIKEGRGAIKWTGLSFGGGALIADLLRDRRNASPEMFPEAAMLPHLIRSRPMFIVEANSDEADQHGGA